jgi:transposase
VCIARSTDGADGLTLHARVVAVERHDLAVDEVLVDLACELRQLVLHIAGNREEHMGRSRGGLTSKIHAVVDAAGLPVQLGLTPGEAHDNRLCPELLARLQPQSMLLADRGYDADWIRALVKQQGASHHPKSRTYLAMHSNFDVIYLSQRNCIRRNTSKLNHYFVANIFYLRTARSPATHA